jgi:hypothetical protein
VVRNHLKDIQLVEIQLAGDGTAPAARLGRLAMAVNLFPLGAQAEAAAPDFR